MRNLKAESDAAVRDGLIKAIDRLVTLHEELFAFHTVDAKMRAELGAEIAERSAELERRALERERAARTVR